MDKWTSVAHKVERLCLKTTLTCGQSFRWKEVTSGEWIGVLGARVFILKQVNDELQYKVLERTQPACSKPVELSVFDISAFLVDYFQLGFDLTIASKQWIEKDANFKNRASSIVGLRVLRQDPTETLFSFLCSSNNNISRITGMIERMCCHYGEKLLTHEGQDYYSFPSVEKLAQSGVENKLRQLGFGYRAQYVADSAKYIMEKGGEAWLHGLRSVDYKDAHTELMNLAGVGPKVADCVCLMALDKMCAVPVDVHVKRFAARDYLPAFGKSKSLTHEMYFKIGDYFRKIWGPYAGWAQEILYMAELQQKTKPQEETETKEEQTTKRKQSCSVKSNKKRK